jgi:hypothetical protein
MDITRNEPDEPSACVLFATVAADRSGFPARGNRACERSSHLANPLFASVQDPVVARIYHALRFPFREQGSGLRSLLPAEAGATSRRLEHSCFRRDPRVYADASNAAGR